MVLLFHQHWINEINGDTVWVTGKLLFGNEEGKITLKFSGFRMENYCFVLFEKKVWPKIDNIQDYI